MSIERTDIEKVANLARIALSEQNITEITERINRVLSLVDQLQAVDTTDIKPMAHPLDAVQLLRTDQVTESNRRELNQKCAPAIENGLYLVPKVID